jgi:acetyltransferase-like isoleucine patch superfamily enzyme
MRNIIKCLLNPLFLINYLSKIKLELKYKKKYLKVGISTSISNSEINNYVYLGDNCHILNCQIGKHTYFNNNSSAKNSKIGKFCSIASNVSIGVGKHPTNMVSTHPAFYANNKEFKTFADKMYYDEMDFITIGNDVWIGSDVKIIGNVCIYDGAIIASGSIVTKDVPPYAIYGGIPAKLIKYRFDNDTINKISKIKWWDFNEDDFISNYKDFQDLDFFINKYLNNLK